MNNFIDLTGTNVANFAHYQIVEVSRAGGFSSASQLACQPASQPASQLIVMVVAFASLALEGVHGGHCRACKMCLPKARGARANWN